MLSWEGTSVWDSGKKNDLWGEILGGLFIIYAGEYLIVLNVNIMYR